jgi:hypothetical protein
MLPGYVTSDREQRAGGAAAVDVSVAAEHACDDRTVDVMYDHRASLASNDPPVPITFRNSRFARRDFREFNRLLKRPGALSLLEHLLPPFTCHNGLSNQPRRIAASIPWGQNRSQFGLSRSP